MMLASATVACLLAAAPVARDGHEHERVARFALVVGYNGSGDADSERLRYADDDAIATDALLREARVTSTLLVEPDADSRRLYPEVAGAPPSRAALLAAYAELRQRMQAARAAGSAVEFLFFYSGHGGVDDGEGYVELAYGKLTRRDLFDELLSPSPADRNHVIIDACRSYYLAFPRAPGGQRLPFAGHVVDLDDARSAQALNTGFLLSTSSDRDSHEWERFGAGIFSHELRSALRGGADADGDGRLTYAELGAFLVKANAAIANPRFRPDFLVRPPGGKAARLSDELLAWPDDREQLLIDAPVGHVYIETPAGERVLDAHPGRGPSWRVSLPAVRPLYVRRLDDAAAESVISSAGSQRLSALPRATARATEKGALHLAFASLFAQPFALDDVESYGARFAADVAREATRAGDARWRRTCSQGGTWLLVGGGATAALGAASLLWAWQRRAAGADASQVDRAALNEQMHTLNRTGQALGAVGAAAALAGAALVLAATLAPTANDVTDLGAAVVPEAQGLTLSFSASW